MILNHVPGIMTKPTLEWEKIRADDRSLVACYLQDVFILAAIAPVSFYFGATHMGWSVGNQTFSLTPESTLPMAVGFYLASLVAVYVMGRAIHWMATTFSVDITVDKCILIATNFITPLFLVGVVALHPVPWLIMLVGLVAMAYTVRLMFTGIPLVMDIDKDKGFIFASAVLTVGLVTMVAVVVVTIIVWSMGFGPQYA